MNNIIKFKKREIYEYKYYFPYQDYLNILKINNYRIFILLKL